MTPIQHDIDALRRDLAALEAHAEAAEMAAWHEPAPAPRPVSRKQVLAIAGLGLVALILLAALAAIR
ncbi:hypothetical protein [Acidiphilium sp.]|uniref:hypothetical protein n=1 Tax=Acidiphilium sp. TaxID=527 RepID=UPI002C3173DE|nr:hypothetical protein [Acidiphilium sp.]HQT62768.1 hypothetical protein [Acidiphilium sp.]